MKRALLVFALGLADPAGGATSSPELRYTSDGQLVRPARYREWIYLSSGLGMTYGAVQQGNRPQQFDNVFVNPEAYRTFLQTGTWPDHTMFALEIRSSTSQGSINKGGYYQEDVQAVEIDLKDEKRFPVRWAFFAFERPDQQTAKPFPPTSRCQDCHQKHGAVDETFVQFYPTLLPIARAKGTFKLAKE